MMYYYIYNEQTKKTTKIYHSLLVLSEINYFYGRNNCWASDYNIYPYYKMTKNAIEPGLPHLILDLEAPYTNNPLCLPPTHPQF